MKSLTVSSLLFVFLFNQLAGATSLCTDLFQTSPTIEKNQIQYPVVVYKKPEIKTAQKTNSKRVTMTKISDEGIKSRLVVEDVPLSKDADQAVLEIIRLLLNNKDFLLNEKNILEKNEMTLGIPLSNDMTFLVSYESRSMNEPRFVVDNKIVLSTATEDFKLTTGLKDPTSLRLAKTDFDLPDFFEKDAVVNLKIPLSIDATVLSQLKKFAKLFEHMDKEELRKILAIESPFKRNALLQLGRVKSMFKKEVLKQPFKILLHGTIMGFITFGINQTVSNHGTDAFQQLNNRPAAVVEVATTKASFTADEALARAQYATIRKEAQQKAQFQKATESVSQTKDLIASGGTSFTVNAHTFIFEQADPLNGSTHTYVVFAEDKVIGKAQALQYFAMEINAAKYAPMIKAIKAHQQIN